MIPTPLTAALAGVATALAWPLFWGRFGGLAQAGSMEVIVGAILIIGLPAHAFVLGFGRTPPPDARSIDTALLKRMGAWLGAAAGTSLLRLLVLG
jgi:hypothetical protein